MRQSRNTLRLRQPYLTNAAFATGGEAPLPIDYPADWHDPGAALISALDLPVAEAACYEAPAWGANPQTIGACGFPMLSTVRPSSGGSRPAGPQPI